VDPEAFKIIDGKLYLNWSSEIADQFATEAAVNIPKADKSWESLTSK
jgi:hypothetical protein